MKEILATFLTGSVSSRTLINHIQTTHLSANNTSTMLRAYYNIVRYTMRIWESSIWMAYGNLKYFGCDPSAPITMVLTEKTFRPFNLVVQILALCNQVNTLRATLVPAGCVSMFVATTGNSTQYPAFLLHSPNTTITAMQCLRNETEHNNGNTTSGRETGHQTSRFENPEYRRLDSSLPSFRIRFKRHELFHEADA